MGTVVFDAARFQAAYPEVQAGDAQFAMWFTQAESLLDNTDHSIVKKLEDRRCRRRLGADGVVPNLDGDGRSADAACRLLGHLGRQAAVFAAP